MDMNKAKRYAVAVLWSTNKYSVAEISEMIEANREFVRRWRDRFEDTGDVEDRQRIGRPREHEEKMRLIVQQYAKDHKKLSTRAISNHFHAEGYQISHSSVLRICNEANIIRCLDVPRTLGTRGDFTKRVQWVNEVESMEIDWECVVFIDEIKLGVNDTPSRNARWYWVDIDDDPPERTVFKYNPSTFQPSTMAIVAFCSKGPAVIHFVRGRVGAEEFVEALKSTILPSIFD